ncbi:MULTISPECIES: ornithine carbamoyltransferase [Methanothermobacter]|uniref:ornithine carbamoyltransferase n=1 Tax=Methanothermobacter TaxID=145260 RepID=UPI0011C730F9|nr:MULTISPECIES: ornithine carbamoyltransferase [unclassified Methanothermobacter]QEF94455.1 ornithine carbamoyltransferase [Methanothermobacter sp. KEPCO-1]QHN07603.1 ornithine carbamoyltransferase [Methanothermobacter sp. THM-2]
MRHLLSVCDMDDVVALLDLADDYKGGEITGKVLEGKTLAMIFEKSSTRTRVSFEVGASQLGAQPLYLSASDLQLGRGEPIADTARTLSRYVDGIMIRAIRHSDVVELASESSVPVINGLTDLEHPCQALADMQTVREKLGDFSGRLVFVGDGNNVCNSLLLITAMLGMDMDVACPGGYEPDPEITGMAEKIARKSGSEIRVLHDPREAVDGADVVYTDVWVSMGYEEEADERLRVFRPYQVNSELMKLASPDAIFMHCLPAVRGQETTSEVIDGPQSVVWDQAENRLHAQKAIMHWLMG